MRSIIWWVAISVSISLCLMFSAAQAAQGAAKESTSSMSADSGLNEIMSAIQWQEGPAQADVGGIAQIKLPAGYVFANGKDTATLLESFGNLVTVEPLGMFAPKTLDWFVVFMFDDAGYVKDDDKDKLDPDAMLKSMRANNKTANKMRKEAGLESLELEGWAVEPRYDETTHNLEWATRLKDESSRVTVNHHTRYLGRKGIMEVTYVGGPESLQDRLPVFKERMREFAFAQGNRYEEYRAGDRVAEYGLTALVVGGAAALAVKSGPFKYLWKLIVIVIGVCIVAFIGGYRLVSMIVDFVRKRLRSSDRPTIYPPDSPAAPGDSPRPPWAPPSSQDRRPPGS
jgi:uncharacterized membrane-anchored protein